MSNEKQQTALQQLKSTIKDGIGNMNGQLNDYKSGYKQCLIDIENVIDKQLLKMEKEQIEEAYKYARAHWSREDGNAEQYYNETYGGNK
jgi:hypothetical protein